MAGREERGCYLVANLDLSQTLNTYALGSGPKQANCYPRNEGAPYRYSFAVRMGNKDLTRLARKATAERVASLDDYVQEMAEYRRIYKSDHEDDTPLFSFSTPARLWGW